MSEASARSDDFLVRAAERLHPELPPYDRVQVTPPPRGDHEHDRDSLPGADAGPPRPAAVLVPVVDRPGRATVLFTERAASLRQHSGQIAFPGGKVDEADASPLEAALREAEEEIGLDRRFVRPLGYLDPYLSSTNFLVLPVVGLVDPGFTLALNPQEVADTFEVPLAFLMDALNHQIHARELRGRMRRYYAIPFEERYIWGVTAGIVRNLYERLYPA